MDSLIKVLIDAVRPPWSYVLGTLGLLLVLAPKIVELRTGWQDFRSDRKLAAAERQRLELLKLRYEIAALKAQHSLPDVDEPVPHIAVGARPEGQESALRLAPRWLRGFPRTARATLLAFRVFIALNIASTAIIAVWLPFIPLMSEQKGEFSVGFVAVAEGLYALMIWGLVALYKVLGRWRTSITVAPS